VEKRWKIGLESMKKKELHPLSKMVFLPIDIKEGICAADFRMPVAGF
jgi:hypothetical protein